MKYPDHLFEELLSEAYITQSATGGLYLQWKLDRIPAELIEGTSAGMAMVLYSNSMWNLWMESFDNTQRAAIRDKLRALRVLKRLEAACSSTGQ